MVAVHVYFLAFSALASLLFVELARRLSLRWGVLDRPIGNKRQAAPVPLLGGLGMFAAVYGTVGLHLAAHALISDAPAWRGLLPRPAILLLEVDPRGLRQLLVIGAGGVAVFVVGLLDDCTFFDMKWRLGAETLVAVAVCALGVRPELRGVPAVVSWPVTVLWIVGVTNAFNLLDGMDGLAAGVALIAGGCMAVFCYLTDQVMVALLLAILCGAAAGFLRYNWAPARVYLGSSGSLFVGYMLATIPLVVGFMQWGSSKAAMAMPLVILSVPLYDTLSVMAIRARHGRSPLRPDHNHVFHRLERLGLSVRQVVGVLYLLTLATGLSAMLLVWARPWETAVVLLHVGALYGALMVIETTGARRRAPPRPAPLCARWFMPGLEAQGGAGEGRLHELGPEGARLQVPAGARAVFARALSEDRLCSLEIAAQDRADEGSQRLVTVCEVHSLQRAEPHDVRVGLRFVPRDAYDADHIRAFVARVLYPDRGTAPLRPSPGQRAEAGRESRFSH